jgi:hypothetical protein
VRASIVVLALAPLATGCRAQRTLEIASDPAGAEVRLDDRAIGKTPLVVPFEHYGTRRVTLHLAGYRTLSEQIRLSPPWFARFPIDILTEVLIPLGLDDHRVYRRQLIPGQEVMSLPSLRSVIDRANVLRQAGPEGPRNLPAVEAQPVPTGRPVPPPEGGDSP